MTHSTSGRTYNPFIFGDPVGPKHFYDRNDAVDFIMDRLYGHSRSSIALWGDRRVGKTSLLYFIGQPKLRREWGKDPAKHHMLFLDLQALSQFDGSHFWEWVIDKISLEVCDTELGRQADALLADGDFSERRMSRFFRRMQQRGETLTLLLDEFTHFVNAGTSSDKDAKRKLLKFLRTQITAVTPTIPNPRPLALITATRRPLHETCQPLYEGGDIGSPFYNPFVAERLKPFTEADVRDLLTESLKGTAVSFTDAETTHLLATAGLHPILVQSYASELFSAKQNSTRTIADFADIDRKFNERSLTWFSDFWRYSSKVEKRLLAKLVNKELDWDNLKPEQENAWRQLKERGLMVEKSFFSPLFAEWIHLNLSQLVTNDTHKPEPDAISLIQALSNHFSQQEVRDLCVELSVNYESLEGDGHAGKARELVLFLQRRNRTDELIALVKRERPRLHLI